jgi:dihydroorotase
VIRGQRVMWDGALAAAAHGRPVRFESTYRP